MLAYKKGGNSEGKMKNLINRYLELLENFSSKSQKGHSSKIHNLKQYYLNKIKVKKEVLVNQKFIKEDRAIRIWTEKD
ncbi:15696_t:CDS:2 [Dentiscutata erythropus]|uniref:15696_t:CDS:1 n=1 Tax=Dentiscutata erythropus TaxID=1348616 RepID=A0A9N9EQM9_9GLOM|nr:15696_t:CDS:2 [Dentiscutata erythropus]